MHLLLFVLFPPFALIDVSVCLQADIANDLQLAKTPGGAAKVASLECNCSSPAEHLAMDHVGGLVLVLVLCSPWRHLECLLDGNSFW